MLDSAKDTLLDATEEVLLSKGVANLTMDGVAQQAGYSKGGLLYHFKTKEDLLGQVINRMVARYKERVLKLRSELIAKGIANATLLALIRSFQCEQDTHMAQLIFSITADKPERIQEFREICDSLDAQVVAESTDETLAQLVVLSLNGMQLRRALGLGADRREQVRNVLDRLEKLVMQAEKKTCWKLKSRKRL